MSGISNPSPQLKPEELTDAFKRALDKPVSWRSVLALGLGWAAEYAMLTLIEDAPVALKVATMLCATAGLAVLQAENWLRKRWKGAFLGAAIFVGAVWLGFMGYALYLVEKDAAVRSGLDQLYNESVPIMSEATPFFVKGASEDELKPWENDIQAWRKKTEAYISRNLGPTFAFRFANTLGHPQYGYGAAQEEVNVQISFLLAMQNNLLGIRDALGHDK